MANKAPETIYAAGFDLMDMPRWSKEKSTLKGSVRYIRHDIHDTATIEPFESGQYRWAIHYKTPDILEVVRIELEDGLVWCLDTFSEKAYLSKKYSYIGPVINPPKGIKND